MGAAVAIYALILPSSVRSSSQSSYARCSAVAIGRPAFLVRGEREGDEVGGGGGVSRIAVDENGRPLWP